MLGAGLIWTSLIYAAMLYSADLKKRVFVLEETVAMISQMKIQLEYLNMPVYEMISSISGKKSSFRVDFIKVCCSLISQGYDFPAAWERAVTDAIYYKSSEKAKLLQLGLNLGTSDKENQTEMLCMYKAVFEEFLKTAREKEKKYSKLSITLGALTGCMFFITAI